VASELLDDRSQEIRYEAIAGLASFANSGFVPREAPLKSMG
jgi:hypothetical protein